MNDKLLRAFIEAQGYEIEEVNNITFGKTITAGDWGCSAATDKEFEFFPATGVMTQAVYREVIRTTDYKVTKKPDPDLIKALDRVVELMWAEYSHVEPEILTQFKKLGWQE